MARRSLLKRLQRATSSIHKSILKKGRNYEERIAAACQNYAGDKVVEQMACCQGEKFCSSAECLCRATRDTMIKTHVACLPHKIRRFKTEWETFKDLAARPTELTVNDVRSLPYALFVGLGLLWLGIVIGRGNIYGFEYDDRVRPVEVSEKAH